MPLIIFTLGVTKCNNGNPIMPNAIPSIQKPKKTLLKRYILTFDQGARRPVIQHIANGLGVSTCYVRAMISGCRSTPAWMAKPLEQLTYGFIPAAKIQPRRKRQANKTTIYLRNAKLQRNTKAPAKQSQAPKKEICKQRANKIN
jgi:DNA-binding transcriptional regulator YdaS (Cro superfamily)